VEGKSVQIIETEEMKDFSWIHGEAEARCFEPHPELHRPFVMLNKSGITVSIKLLIDAPLSALRRFHAEFPAAKLKGRQDSDRQPKPQ
jgi:hypothetical protein